MFTRVIVLVGLAVALATCGGKSDGESSSGGHGAAGSTGGKGGSSGASGAGAAAGTGASGGAGGMAGAAGASGFAGSAGAACPASCVEEGFSCCGPLCVNLRNDIRNCGRCGNVCAETPPYCAGDTCSTAPCAGAFSCKQDEFCCGQQCCRPGQLCCNVPGPVVSQYPQCTDATPEGTCPLGCLRCVCAAPDTPVATPWGEVPIASLRVGDLVYSVDRCEVRAVPVRRAHRVRVTDHTMLRVTLPASVLEVSPGHPTADGRTFLDLQPGDDLGGLQVRSVERFAYAYSHTYDILPDSDSGTYFAGGALIGSTLASPDTPMACGF